ncbi:class I SAM-dependent methyltransferase [Kineobactrum sediminis]|uniref:Class I SAM-dependent methyltransferase n=2 Tax=Kineobactrum sediminis TaxID=1905677 RepID=A0A2N5Y138_9GAMM|nr:class I SAM-dependent methyltransferase [Kineobactrum sediminis]
MMGECSDILTELESWYQTDQGLNLQASLQSALEPILDTAFGYHLVQVGHTRQQPLCNNSRIHHRAYIAPQGGQHISLVAEAAELPLESESVDVVVAHHCLEFSAQPHQVLRELHRVLTPQGQLLLIGFNPYSLLGMVQRLRGLVGNSLWQEQHAVGRTRLLDWLRLLGFEQENCHFLSPLPVGGSGSGARLAGRLNAWSERHKLPLGGVYVMHAVKQVGGSARPVRRARSRPRLIGLSVPAATPRQGDHAA